MGIQAFSKPSVKKVIFAANAHKANLINASLAALKIEYRALIGAYQGKQENSWIINYSDLEHVNHLLEGEESLLILESPNSRSQYKSILQFLDGKPSIDLGYAVEVSKDEALASEAYTQDFYVNHVGKVASHYWMTYQLDKFGQPIKE
jgi:hypothetical protein